MKHLLVCPFYQRYDVTEFVFDFYRKIKIQLQPQFDINLLAVGSEGKDSQDVAERNGWDYTEYPNSPLNRKFNHGIKQAKEYDPDVLFWLNSDDILSAEYFLNIPISDKYISGLSDFYFLDFYRKRLGYWGGYMDSRKAGPIGPGRVFSREMLETCDWQPWDDRLKLDSRLDINCRTRLSKLSIQFKAYRMSELDCIGIDIKKDLNIWQWHEMKYDSVLNGSNMMQVLNQAKIGNIFESLK